MKAKKLMASQPIHYCNSDTTLTEAAKKMKQANCGVLPVVDKNKKLVGIVTDRDICMSLPEDDSLPSRRSVEKVMTTKVYSVSSEDDISNALRLMRMKKIGRLPVVDGSKKLVGILSLHFLLSHSAKLGYEPYSKSGENLVRTVKSISKRYSRRNLVK